jgi:hypothetical protein
MTADTDTPTTHRRPWWRGWPPAIVAVLLAVITITGLTTALATRSQAAVQAPGLTHQSWTERDGRVCTAAAAGGSVALSCAYRPLLVGTGQ